MTDLISPLSIQEVLLKPGEEMPSRTGAWHFLRVDAGWAYWLEKPAAIKTELNAGDVIMLAPQAAGTVLASRNGQFKGHGFSVYPARLFEVLSAHEYRYLTLVAPKTKPAMALFHPAHVLSRQFEQLRNTYEKGMALSQCCQMLTMLMTALQPGWPVKRTELKARVGVTERFNQLAGQLSEEENLLASRAELAKKCGCGVRHLNRLFVQHLGKSIGAKQTELRIHKARYLLAKTSDKIIDIAMNCGFRNLGLFNRSFKQCCEMTPTEWRRQHTGDPGENPKVDAPLSNIIGFF